MKKMIYGILLITFSTSNICPQIPASKTNIVPKFVSIENLKNHIFEIAGDAYEGRGAGYAGERMAADYIARQFEKYKLAPVVNRNGSKKSYFQEFTFDPRKPVNPNQQLVSRNVIGFFEGSDKKLKQEIIIIGAHYDGQGKTGEADAGRLIPKDNSLADEIWNSADDNASSVAALLEIVRIIAENKLTIHRSILFIAFGAEEHALNGSFYYVNNPVFQWKRHVAMLNLEKLGRIPDAVPITASSSTSPIWEKVISESNKKTGLEVKSLLPEIIADTDHYPFALRKIPPMVIGMAHEEDTHLPSDSAEKISFESLAVRTEYVLNVLLELTNTSEQMNFTGDLRYEPGVMVVIPNESELNELHLDSHLGGVKVSAIMPTLPAYKSGLRIGDIILQINGTKIERNQDAERNIRDAAITGKPVLLQILHKGKFKDLVMKF